MSLGEAVRVDVDAILEELPARVREVDLMLVRKTKAHASQVLAVYIVKEVNLSSGAPVRSRWGWWRWGIVGGGANTRRAAREEKDQGKQTSFHEAELYL